VLRTEVSPARCRKRVTDQRELVVFDLAVANLDVGFVRVVNPLLEYVVRCVITQLRPFIPWAMPSIADADQRQTWRGRPMRCQTPTQRR
jgi:hypothetical protein